MAAMKIIRTSLVIAAALIAPAATAQQPEAVPPPGPLSGKIGYVDSDRVMKTSRMTRNARQALEDKFKKLAADIQAEGPPEKADRRLLALDDEYRVAHEDALRQYVDRANRIIRRIAMAENIDIVFLEAVYSSPRIDLTDKVIQALDAEP
jgi:outer membrane protein